MKKLFIVFLLILIALNTSACDLSSSNSNKLDNTETSGDALDNIQIPNDTTNDTSSTVESEDGTLIKNSAEREYISFDEVLPLATDVIKARYVNMSMEYDGTCYFEFDVIESVRGLNLETKITVENLATEYYIDGDICYSSYDIGYTKGNSYLLLLIRHTSVFSDQYHFNFVHDGLYIPLDDSEKSTLNSKECKMYSSNLKDHIESQDILNAFNTGTFEEYAKKIIEPNPFVLGVDYIKSTAIEDVIKGSEYVFEVTVKEKDPFETPPDRIWYICDVITAYKGVHKSNSINIIFPINTVEPGKSYIVAVQKISDSSIFIISSKNSVFSTDLKDQIENLIGTDGSIDNETSGEHPVSIYFHSLSAYKELFEAVNYTDEELDAFLHAYPEYHVANGIANREELLAFIKLIESTPLPFFADESVIEGFGLEYQPDAKVFDVIYGIGGQRYRFTIWDVGNEASDSIHEDSNVTTVSTHMIGDIEIGLYNSGTENIYYDSFRISNYEIEVLAYDDTKTCQFDFSGFSIE